MTQEEINQLMEDSESEPEGQAEAAQTRDLTQIAQPVESNYDNVIELPQLGLAEHSVDSPCYGVLSPLDIETPSVQEKSLQVSKSPKLQFEGDSAESDPSNDLAIISADTSSISHSPLIDWSNEKSILIPGFENETVSLEDQLFGSVIMEASACTSESLCNRLNDSDHTITHPPVVDHFSKSDNDNTLKVETTADRLNDEILAEKATSLGNSISEPQVEDKVPQSDNIQLLGTAESLNEEIVSSKAIALGACISEPQVGDSVPQFDSTQQLATADSLSDDKLAAKASVSGECISEPQIDLQFTLQLDTSDSLNGDAPSIKAGASGNNTREHQTDESVSRLNNNNTHVAADHDESQASEEANTPSRIIKKIYMKDWFLIKKGK